MKARRRRNPTQRLVQVLLLLVFGAVVLLAERVFETAGGPPAGTLPDDARGPCRVVKVVDGDTVRMRCDGEESKVRLLRIDTPERDEPGYDEATRALREMLDGRDVYYAFEDPERPTRGNYGRLLVYLFADGRNVNVEMVREGHSDFDTRWGEGRFARSFRDAEREAGRL